MIEITRNPGACPSNDLWRAACHLQANQGVQPKSYPLRYFEAAATPSRAASGGCPKGFGGGRPSAALRTPRRCVQHRLRRRALHPAARRSKRVESHYSERPLVVCPVHNEGEAIAEFYRELRRCYPGDVLFVDDGSTDQSRKFLSKLQEDRTFLIRHPRRLGYGGSLLAGFDFAREGGYEKIVTIDSDLQHLPHHIPVFLAGLDRYEVVLGSRYIKVKYFLDIPRPRMVINRYIAGLFQVLFLSTISDPFCGLRGYRGSFLRKARLSEIGYGLSLEIIMEIIRTKTEFLEVPIEAIYLDYSRNFLDGLDRPRPRLLYYLEVIARKTRSMTDEEKSFDYQPPSG